MRNAYFIIMVDYGEYFIRFRLNNSIILQVINEIQIGNQIKYLKMSIYAAMRTNFVTIIKYCRNLLYCTELKCVVQKGAILYTPY